MSSIRNGCWQPCGASAAAISRLASRSTAPASPARSRRPSTMWSTSTSAWPGSSRASPWWWAAREGVAGTWKDLTASVNSMAGNLTTQVRNSAEVTTAVANGDLSKKITVDVKGEILQLKDTINTMVDQLNAFASEVTRVAREV